MNDDRAIEVAAWNGAPVETWRERWGLPALRVFRRLASTNDLARELAEQGAAAGSTLIAEEQTRGRGRRGRAWTAAPGQSLLLSMVLRPEAPDTGALPLRVGLAAARALEAGTGIAPGLKWPNDLVVGGRKLGGVLCEGALEGGRTSFVIAGVGLNLLQSDDDFPSDLRGTATSVAAAGGRPDIAALAGRLIRELSIAGRAGGAPLEDDEMAELDRRDVLRGREVTVDGRPAGRADGFDPDGALRVVRDGAARRIITGTIRLADDGAAEPGDHA